MLNKYKYFTALIVMSGLLLSGCTSIQDGKEYVKTISDPSISGNYKDNYGNSQVIDSTRWVSSETSSFEYTLVDNLESYLIAKNNSNNQYNPNKYSRFEWANSNGKLWYCQQVYDVNTEEDAGNFTLYPRANSSSPNTKGCGLGAQSFPWSELVPN